MINYQIYNIRDSIILHTKLINENDFEKYCIQLTTDDLNLFFQIQSIQRKKEFITTRILLKQYFNLNIILSYENKKPKLKNSTFISLSHKDEELIIGINDSTPIGVDIEKISNKISKIKHKFCDAKELFELNNIDSNEILTMYWCAKEATYKCLTNQTNIYLKDITVKLKTKAIGQSENSDLKYRLDFLKINEQFIICHAQKQR